MITEHLLWCDKKINLQLHPNTGINTKYNSLSCIKIMFIKKQNTSSIVYTLSDELYFSPANFSGFLSYYFFIIMFSP